MRVDKAQKPAEARGYNALGGLDHLAPGLGRSIDSGVGAMRTWFLLGRPPEGACDA